MRISDWSSDVCSSDLTKMPAKPALVAAGMQSGLVVGVIVDGESRGAIAIHSKEVDAFGSDEQYFMTAVANIVSGALARDEAQERMRDLALHDPLTGLPNRAMFRSEEHTSELQSLMRISSAVFC